MGRGETLLIVCEGIHQKNSSGLEWPVLDYLNVQRAFVEMDNGSAGRKQVSATGCERK